MSKIILITSQKGGTGKSTLTYLLANNICKYSKVAVIDYDPQGSLSQLKELVTEFDIIPFKREIEDILKLDYDFFLWDTAPYLSNHLPSLIKLADLIVVPTKAGILDLLAIKSTIELIELEKGKNKALIVFNMIKSNSTITREIKNQLVEYNVSVAKTKISDLVAFTRSVVLKEVKDNSNAQKQIDELTKEILTHLI